MATASRKQDMPPPGGFRPLNFERVTSRSYFSTPTLFLGYIGITAVSMYLIRLAYKEAQRDKIEMRSSLHAILPLLYAERDRAFLKQLRLNREEERELMKNVEGWEVGTYYGEPIYKNQPEDAFFTPRMREYYIHSAYKDATKRLDRVLWN